MTGERSVKAVPWRGWQEGSAMLWVLRDLALLVFVAGVVAAAIWLGEDSVN
jgi:hypothetical protein